MSYIEKFEAELTAKLDSETEDTAAIVRFVREKMVESYSNGIALGMKRLAAASGSASKAE